MAIMRYIGCLRVVTVEPCFIMATVAFISHYFSLPQLLVAKICDQKYNETVCSDLSSYHDIQNKVQAESALWLMIIGLSSALPSIPVILTMGPISDILGRKIFLICVPGVLALQSIALTFNAYYMTLHTWYLLPGFLFPVLVGNFQGVVLLSYAYIAQVTVSGHQRTMRMAFIGGSLTVAISMAGLLSGYIIERHGYPTLYVITLAISVANGLYTFLFVPTENEYLASCVPLLKESEQQELERSDITPANDASPDTPVETKEPAREQTRPQLPGPLQCIQTSIQIVMEPAHRKRRILLLVTFGFTILAILGEVNIIILYLKHAPFSFTALELGLFLAGSQVLKGLGGALIPQVILRTCPVSDFILAGLGFISKITTDIWVAFSTSNTMLVVSLFIGVGGSLPSICLRSAISKTVTDHRYGTVLCTLAAVNELFIALSDIIANNVYRWTVGWFPGFQFLVSASFCTVGLLIITYLQCKDYDKEKSERVPLIATEADETIN